MKKTTIIFLLFWVHVLNGSTNGFYHVSLSPVSTTSNHTQRMTFKVTHLVGSGFCSYEALGIKIKTTNPGVVLDTVFVSGGYAPDKIMTSDDVDANGLYLLGSGFSSNVYFDVTFDFTISSDVGVVPALVEVCIPAAPGAYSYCPKHWDGMLSFNGVKPEVCTATFPGGDVYKENGVYKLDIPFSGISNCPQARSYHSYLKYDRLQLSVDSVVVSSVGRISERYGNYDLFSAEYNIPFNCVVSFYFTPLVAANEFKMESFSLYSGSEFFLYGSPVLRLIDPSIVTSVDDANAGKAISATPNPLRTFDDLHVQLEKSSTFELINQQGVSVQQGKFDAGDNVLKISQSGFYMLQIADQKAVRIIVE